MGALSYYHIHGYDFYCVIAFMGHMVAGAV